MFPDVWPIICRSPKTPKNGRTQKPSKIINVGFRFGMAWMLFGCPFFDQFHDPAKPLKFQQVQSEIVVFASQGLHKQSQKHVCSRRRPGHLLYFILVLYKEKTIDLGTPLKIQWVPKWNPKSTSGAKNLDVSASHAHIVSVA